VVVVGAVVAVVAGVVVGETSEVSESPGARVLVVVVCFEASVEELFVEL
jgi:hypothetical protein